MQQDTTQLTLKHLRTVLQRLSHLTAATRHKRAHSFGN